MAWIVLRRNIVNKRCLCNLYGTDCHDTGGSYIKVQIVVGFDAFAIFRKIVLICFVQSVTSGACL